MLLPIDPTFRWEEGYIIASNDGRTNNVNSFLESAQEEVGTFTATVVATIANQYFSSPILTLLAFSCSSFLITSYIAKTYAEHDAIKIIKQYAYHLCTTLPYIQGVIMLVACTVSHHFPLIGIIFSQIAGILAGLTKDIEINRTMRIMET